MAIWWRAVGLGTVVGAWTVFNYAQAAVDRLCRDKVEPIRGSILYCDYRMGLAEHTGVYVGDGRIVNMSGHGLIERTTPRGFVEGKTALLGNIYVSCLDKQAVGIEAVAQLAEAAVGESINYDFASNNCHGFVVACLTVAGLEGEEPLDVSALNACVQKLKRELHHRTGVDVIYNPNRLHAVKSTANKYLGSNTWRVWDT